MPDARCQGRCGDGGDQRTNLPGPTSRQPAADRESPPPGRPRPVRSFPGESCQAHSPSRDPKRTAGDKTAARTRSTTTAGTRRIRSRPESDNPKESRPVPRRPPATGTLILTQHPEPADEQPRRQPHTPPPPPATHAATTRQKPPHPNVHTLGARSCLIGAGGCLSPPNSSPVIYCLRWKYWKYFSASGKRRKCRGVESRR